MTREEVIKKYRAGITLWEGYETEEWLVDEATTTATKLMLQAYDANMMPSPNFSQWSEKAQARTKNMMLVRLEDFDGDVWLDDVKLK